MNSRIYIEVIEVALTEVYLASRPHGNFFGHPTGCIIYWRRIVLKLPLDCKNWLPHLVFRKRFWFWFCLRSYVIDHINIKTPALRTSKLALADLWPSSWRVLAQFALTWTQRIERAETRRRLGSSCSLFSSARSRHLGSDFSEKLKASWRWFRLPPRWWICSSEFYVRRDPGNHLWGVFLCREFCWTKLFRSLQCCNNNDKINGSPTNITNQTITATEFRVQRMRVVINLWTTLNIRSAPLALILSGVLWP